MSGESHEFTAIMRTTHSVHEIWLMDMVYILTKRIEKLAYRSVRAKESGLRAREDIHLA